MTSENRAVGAVVPWAVYLGTSWLWCVGAFYPVMLYRDYGHGSWLLFTIPNVVGAAAVPWVLRSPGASHAFVEKYRTACTWFSRAVIGFHLFFIGWLSQLISFGVWSVAVVVGLVIAAASLVGGRASLLAGCLVWLGSMAMMAYVLWIADAATLGFSEGNGLLDMTLDGYWLIPTLFISFALCPYLDLTFHRARQALEGGRAKLVFASAFFGVFLVGLIFTLLYASPMARVLSGDTASVPARLVLAVGIHLVLQSSFTAAEHFRSILVGRRIRYTHAITAVALVALARLVPSGSLFGMSYTEHVYRTFLLSVGLLGPVFVWVALASRRAEPDHSSPPIWGLSRHAFRIGLFTVASALPFYAAAFLGQSFGLTWLALPGVVVILLAGLFVRSPSPLATSKASRT